MKLEEGIRQRSCPVTLALEEIRTLPLAAEQELAWVTGSSLKEVELTALEAGILPGRYLRNWGTVGLAGQKKLLSACVAVLGAGGLGGWIVELLARMGVGRLVVVDGDVFQENNLNRQLLATEASLGQAKAMAAAARAKEVNGAVEVLPRVAWLTGENARELVHPGQVAVDALDNLPARFLLQDAARDLDIPLVHGAIGGYQGQVMTIFPGDRGLDSLYPGGREGMDRGVEVILGNPAATPPLVAAWQVQEVVKIILGEGELLRERLLFLDAFSNTVEVFQL